MPPTPRRANLRPADGFVAGTLQKTSCAASRRSDHPASSEGAGGLGEVVGASEATTVVTAATLPSAASAVPCDAQPSAPAAAAATAVSISPMRMPRSRLMPADATTGRAQEPAPLLCPTVTATPPRLWPFPTYL